MLADLFPKVHRSYSTLPVLGPVLDGFAEWLSQHGYPRVPICRHVRTARHIDHVLQRRGCKAVGEVTREALHGCAQARARDHLAAATVRSLERYLAAVGVLGASAPPTMTEMKTAAYAKYLEDVRGLAPTTIVQHLSTARQFLQHVGYESHPSWLSCLRMSHIEAFVQVNGERLGRGSLQHVIAQLRSFLRFLAALNL
jgi:integrase/recombinase XerD